MKIIPIFVLFAVFTFGCNNRSEELQQQTAALQSVNAQLSRDIAARDEYVDKVTNAINDVYTNIEDVKVKEKSLLKETTGIEAKKKMSNEQVRSQLIDRVGLIRAALSDDHKRLLDLQTKLASSKKQYLGLQKMVENLKITLEERDQSIADLGKRVQGLEQEVNDKNIAITQKDSIIGTQYRVITTGYYISGTRDQLEKMGIIKKEGGFLWGLFGSTTQMVSGFDGKYFKPLNKTVDNTIQVNGKIDEIIPRRNENFYKKTELGESQSMLTIAEPDNFWKDNYLVIITDRPNNMIAQQ
jgi:uncharacterized protein YoxC